MSDASQDDLRSQPVLEAPVDPIGMARRDLKKALPRRFYSEVTTGPTEGGFGILLDGKPVRTPAKLPLVVPTPALAEALAAEWRAQGDLVEPDTMPMTRLANSASLPFVPVSRSLHAASAKSASGTKARIIACPSDWPACGVRVCAAQAACPRARSRR